MKALINPRSAARLAAASAVVLSLAPVGAAASTAPPTLPGRHARATDALCDGHRWSLFGCRPDHRHTENPTS